MALPRLACSAAARLLATFSPRAPRSGSSSSLTGVSLLLSKLHIHPCSHVVIRILFLQKHF